MLDKVQAARDQIIDDIEAAWKIRALGGEIIIGKPRRPIKNAPYAIIRLDSVPMASEGISTRSEVFQFEVLGRFDIPADVILEDHKVLLASALGDLTIYNLKTKTGVNIPQVTEVLFSESDDPAYPVFEISLIISCMIAGQPWLVQPS